ncbi:MAG: hypothetical protein ACOX37_06820 [Bacillota bacterium]
MDPTVRELEGMYPVQYR